MSKNRALCHSLLCEFEHPSVKSKATYFLFNFKSKNTCAIWLHARRVNNVTCLLVGHHMPCLIKKIFPPIVFGMSHAYQFPVRQDRRNQ